MLIVHIISIIKHVIILKYDVVIDSGRNEGGYMDFKINE